MRQLASYSFEARASDPPLGTHARLVLDLIESWLQSKGNLADDGQSLALNDGRMAEISRATLASSHGSLNEIVVTEPRPDGWFRTGIKVAESADTVAMSVNLSAASAALAPVYVDVRCPRLVRDLLSSPSPWNYQGTPLSSVPLDYSGDAGGDRFISLAWNPDRSVPIVAVSDEYGSVLHPGIVERLAGDLAGLALVARLDPDASWSVTRQRGKEWSCYSGAIRLLWPRLDSDSSPYQHPLWTPARLLASVSDTEAAAERICRELRRRILGQSTFAISDPPLFLEVRQASRQEELEALRAKGTADADYKALADEYFGMAVRSNATIEERDKEILELRAKIVALQHALQSKGKESEDVEPETDTPPATVDDAVQMAVEEHREEIALGDSVAAGIRSLARDAGPPAKILTYLRVLAELAIARRKGPLGTSMIKWIQDRGLIASAESETIKNSKREQQARTWDCGNGERRAFDLHLKPSDATAPDRCVRIYFDYDEKRQKIVVGWIGRHL